MLTARPDLNRPLPGSGSKPECSPDLLLIGNVTRDLQPDGSFQLGGTSAFAAVAAQRLGLRPAVVSRGRALDLDGLIGPLTGVPLALRDSEETTTFENRYQNGRRRQRLTAHAGSISQRDVPGAWKRAPAILLAPVANELGAGLLDSWIKQPGQLVAATAQGWLRRWDARGFVSAAPLAAEARILSQVDALILSEDDLEAYGPPGSARREETLKQWSLTVRWLVVTAGSRGAALFTGTTRELFPAFLATEVDPTGAGDVFAASFLAILRESGDVRRAMRFANCAASFVVERAGILGIPERPSVVDRQAQRQSQNRKPPAPTAHRGAAPIAAGTG